MPTIISRKADNWVDRGEPAGPKLASVLAHLFDRHAESDVSWLREQATTILGMVEAGATEVHVAGYLRSVARDLGYAAGSPAGLRLVAVALWHAAKAALVRDFAERVLKGDVPPNAPSKERFSQWLAARLLSPEELQAFERDGREREAP
jgi:hypothetical protein